jgi:hypothetical protein
LVSGAKLGTSNTPEKRMSQGRMFCDQIPHLGMKRALLGRIKNNSYICHTKKVTDENHCPYLLQDARDRNVLYHGAPVLLPVRPGVQAL